MSNVFFVHCTTKADCGLRGGSVYGKKAFYLHLQGNFGS